MFSVLLIYEETITSTLDQLAKIKIQTARTGNVDVSSHVKIKKIYEETVFASILSFRFSIQT